MNEQGKEPIPYKDVLKSSAKNGEPGVGGPSDTTHGFVKRQVHGNIVSLPITEQHPLPDLGAETPKSAVTRRADTPNLDPEHKYILESIDTGEEPVPTTARMTRAQSFARQRGRMKQAQKKSRGIEVPPEGYTK